MILINNSGLSSSKTSFGSELGPSLEAVNEVLPGDLTSVLGPLVDGLDNLETTVMDGITTSWMITFARSWPSMNLFRWISAEGSGPTTVLHLVAATNLSGVAMPPS